LKTEYQQKLIPKELHTAKMEVFEKLSALLVVLQNIPQVRREMLPPFSSL